MSARNKKPYRWILSLCSAADQSNKGLFNAVFEIAEPLEILVQPRHLIRKDQDADSQYQDSTDDFESAEVSLEAVIEGQESVQTKAGHEERNAETCGIDK